MHNLSNETAMIREVWSSNLEQEFELIRSVIDDFPIVGLDTEYPGTVKNPYFRSNVLHEAYNHMKENMDVLKILQLGLAFCDEQGNLPTCGTAKYCVWQFNFGGFNLSSDLSAEKSIAMLQEAGMKFEQHRSCGVDPARFGELLMSSGAVMRDPLRDACCWVTFQGSNDFALLIRILTGGKALPETPKGFFELMRVFFPVFYDLKEVAWACRIPGGLQRVAEIVGARRVGRAHLAGSDSLLTLCAFMKVKELYFHGKMPGRAGVLVGLEDWNFTKKGSEKKHHHFLVD